MTTLRTTAPRRKKTMAERYPLASFDPRYRDLWLKSIHTTQRMQFATPADAAAFQKRLQLYRAVAMELRIPGSELLYRAGTSRKGPLLTVGRLDERYEHLFADFLPGVPDASATSASAAPAAHDAMSHTAEPHHEEYSGEAAGTPLSREELDALFDWVPIEDKI